MVSDRSCPPPPIGGIAALAGAALKAKAGVLVLQRDSPRCLGVVPELAQVRPDPAFAAPKAKGNGCDIEPAIPEF